MVNHNEMLFSDFPQIGEITSKTKAQNMKRIFTGGVRIGGGMFRTDKAQKKFIKKQAKRKLP